MKEFDADIIAVPRGDNNKTEVTFSLNYIVKYGPLGHIMGKTIMKYEMKKLVSKVFAATVLIIIFLLAKLLGRTLFLPSASDDPRVMFWDSCIYVRVKLVVFLNLS